ncbi:MAG TPA: outer membrane lipoprotein carrier protein LolA [Candidatus Sumerlaeota bacterium]|nr:outer membrane lipoprotein carrier protein LolA [Candidatus Sumerlaeota bacterium]HPS02647.1 outer membrane lipoprotein carrier protein LolA [Candidatus Sumerlaeota bacterium]
MSKHVAKATSSAVWGLAIGLALSFTSTRTLAQAPTAPAQTPPAKAAVESITTFSTPTLSAAAATTTEVVRKQPTPEIQSILKDLETKHANLKTVQAEFGQVKVWQEFNEVKSQGKLYIEQPSREQAGRLRCDLEAEKGEQGIEPSSTLFVNNTLFDYTPALKQVDKITFDSEDEAREQLRMLLLGFGVSSQEILSSYNVEKAGNVPETAKTEKPLVGLSFIPLKKEVRNQIVSVSVWLNRDTLLPHCIQIKEVSENVTTITIRSLKLDEPIKASLFEPKWPANVKVIEYDNKGQQ